MTSGRGFIALAALNLRQVAAGAERCLPVCCLVSTEAVSIQMQGAIKLPAFFATCCGKPRVMIFRSSLFRWSLPFDYRLCSPVSLALRDRRERWAFLTKRRNSRAAFR